MKEEKCPDCGSTNIICGLYNGELACNDCGLVLDDKPVTNGYISEAIKNEARNPVLISHNTKPVNGKIIKDHWLYSTKEKNLKAGLYKIERISSRLRLPKYAVTESKIIFKQALNKNLSVGRDNISFTYASVYAACKIHGIPKMPLEVIAFTDVSKKALLRSYRILVQELNLNTKPIDPSDLVNRFANKLELNQETINKTLELLDLIKETKVSVGRRPETILASALYLAGKITGEKITQRNVANATGVIEVTIRKRSKEIIEVLR